MNEHRNLPLVQQQTAIEREPGFQSLKSQEQLRIHNLVTRLNTMPPEQRQRTLERTEAMERLTPPQRQQVRNAMAALGSLPEERHRIVARTFYALRDMPDGRREMYMNSPQFRAQFNDPERAALQNLLNVAPIYPPLQPGAQQR